MHDTLQKIAPAGAGRQLFPVKFTLVTKRHFSKADDICHTLWLLTKAGLQIRCLI